MVMVMVMAMAMAMVVMMGDSSGASGSDRRWW